MKKVPLRGSFKGVPTKGSCKGLFGSSFQGPLKVVPFRALGLRASGFRVQGLREPLASTRSLQMDSCKSAYKGLRWKDFGGAA